MRINLKAVLFGQGADVALHLPHVQPQLSRKAQNDVFGRGQHVHQLKMLMNHADAQSEGVLGRADDHLAALHIDMARVRKINAGQHVHQRRLAAAVLAQHAQNFAAAHGQVHVLIGDHRAEMLGDAAHLDHCVGLQGFSLRVVMNGMKERPAALAGSRAEPLPALTARRPR